MSIHNINVFVSHSWAYSDHYNTLSDWIFDETWSVGQASLNFRDYSVPKDDPIHNAPNAQALQSAIFSKIALCHVIVIPTGMYSQYSTWIQKEIDGAKHFGKPILAVNPWNQERKSTVVVQAATDHCGWNKKTIVSKVWNLYRSP